MGIMTLLYKTFYHTHLPVLFSYRFNPLRYQRQDHHPPIPT